MVLVYSMHDSEMSGVIVLPPEIRSVQPKQSRARRCVKFGLLLICSMVVWGLVLLHYFPDVAVKLPPILGGARPLVSGVMYNAEAPLAVIQGRVVHQGDVVDGYRVVKIHPDKVELLRGNKQVIEPIRTPPAKPVPKAK